MVERRLDVPGTFNLRDVGGYTTADGRTVKARTLFRSDALHKVDEDGRALLVGLGVASSVDLREDDEKVAAPSALPASVRVVEIPLFTYAAPGVMTDAEIMDRRSLQSLEAVYELLISTRGPVLVEVLRELARPGTLPAIVHCTAGKDRTGVVIALVLSALGVPDEVVAIDYAATSLFLGEEFRAQAALRNLMPGYDEERLSRMLACEPAFILDVLAAVRREHGSVEGYLAHHGLSADELAALRDALLEPSETTTDTHVEGEHS